MHQLIALSLRILSKSTQCTPQVVEWSQKFLAAGEAFVGGELGELRTAIAGLTSRHFDTFHRSNMEVCA